MKKVDLENAITSLKELKSFTDRLEYNTSTFVNQKLMTVFPVLQAEYDRLDNDKVVINCPKLLIVGSKDVTTKQTLTDFVNDKLQELVMNDYKIIDYGLWGRSNEEILIYIKYTS